MITTLSDQRPQVVANVWSPEYFEEEFLRFAILDLKREHGDPEHPFGVYILDALDPRSCLGRVVELERFGGQFGNDLAMLRDLYVDYEDCGNSELCIVVDHLELRPVGVIRLTRHTEEFGSRTIDDLLALGENGWGLSKEELWTRAPLAAKDLNGIVDVPTLAVSVGYHGNDALDSISRALSACMFKRILSCGSESMICALDRIVAALVQSITGNFLGEFEGIGPQPYYGSPGTIPMWSNPREQLLRIQTSEPELYERFVLLKGLDKYFFAWPEDTATWEEIDELVIDLRDSSSSENSLPRSSSEGPIRAER